MLIFISFSVINFLGVGIYAVIRNFF